MFYGTFEHSIDKKGRLIIPSKFRESFKEHYIEKFFITTGLDKCLFMFTEDEWRHQESRLKTNPFTKSDARKFNRLYFAGASEVLCDKQGRILIPKYLKDFASIRKDVVIIGVSNRIEIWDKGMWADYYDSSKKSYEEIAEKLLDQEG
jgi:MraZ protein